MAITVTEPDYLSSFYVPLFNPILFTFTATAGETKVLIQVKDSAGAILQDNIILLFNASNTVTFDASTYLKPSNSNALNAGQYTDDINDTNSIVEFYLTWDEYPQPSPEATEDTTHFFATNAALQIGNTAGNNLYNEIPVSPKAGTFLTEFEKVRHWEGYPQTVSFISAEGGIKKIVTSAGVETKTAYQAYKSVAALLLPDKGEDYTIQVLDGVVFTTSWNLTSGNFTTVATGISTTTVWTLPDETEVTIDSLNTALGGFDGTPKDVIIGGFFYDIQLENKLCSGLLDLTKQTLTGNVSTVRGFIWLSEAAANGYGFNEILFSEFENETNYLFIRNNDNLINLDMSNLKVVLNTVARMSVTNMSVLTSILFKSGSVFTELTVNNCPLVTTIDFSGFTSSGASATFSFDAMSGITNITLFSGNVASFLLEETLLTSLDLTNNASPIVNVNSNSLMTAFTFSSTATVLTTVNLLSNVLSTIDLGGATIGPTTTAFNFLTNAMSTAEVDTVFADLDAVASGGSSGSINGAGSNAAPTGGAANANVVSLVAKGFTVTITP